MSGMNRQTGLAIADEREHIAQSITDILTTPVGSRLRRRPYGSIVPDLIDQPFNAALRLRLMAASLMAIARWEPRVSIPQGQSATIDFAGNGVLSLSVIRTTGPRAGQPIDLTVKL